MFTAPSNPAHLEKRQRSIAGSHRTLTSNECICHLHFDRECIEQLFDPDTDGNTDGQDRGCPKPVDGAVPHIFPNSPAAGKRSSSERSCGILQKIRKLVQKQAMQYDSLSATDDSGSHRLFSELCKESDSVCPDSWRSTCNGDYVCFAKLQVISGQAVITMSVSISKDLDMRVFHGGLPVSHSFPDRVCTRDEVTTVLRQLTNSHVFAGNPNELSVHTKPAHRTPVDDSLELDLSAVCNLDTSVTDV